MGITKIEWSNYVFNCWVGCEKVSPACDSCYAESWAKRTGHPELWNGERRRTTEAYWRQPLKWDAKAAAEGQRMRVFCASLADVFDEYVPDDWRDDLWDLIGSTSHLDWLLLTKRPQNIMNMLPPDWLMFPSIWQQRIWLGTTVENQEEADRRIPHLLAIPATVHFLSCEPLLGPIYFHRVPGFNRIGLSLFGWWIISGDESGPHARETKPEWRTSLRDQCRAAGVPLFQKQITIRGRKVPFEDWPSDMQIREFPRV